MLFQIAIVIVSFCTSFFKVNSSVHYKTLSLSALFMIFQPSDFEANVTVNVTMLLVLTTLFISISDALPRTSYVKLVDIWLITNLMIPFVEIILQSLMNVWYKDHENNEPRILKVTPVNPGIKVNDNINEALRKNKKLLNIMRLLTRTALPGFYILFCIVFFLYGMIVSNA